MKKKDKNNKVMNSDSVPGIKNTLPSKTEEHKEAFIVNI